MLAAGSRDPGRCWPRLNAPLAWLDGAASLWAPVAACCFMRPPGRLFGLAPSNPREEQPERWRPLVVSQMLLWILVVVLALVVLGLARQIGVLHERVAPLGALTTRTAVGDGRSSAGVRHSSTSPAARSISGGRPSTSSSQLLLFVSPTCPMCKKLLPVGRAPSRRGERRRSRRRAHGRRRTGPFARGHGRESTGCRRLGR